VASACGGPVRQTSSTCLNPPAEHTDKNTKTKTDRHRQTHTDTDMNFSAQRFLAIAKLLWHPARAWGLTAEGTRKKESTGSNVSCRVSEVLLCNTALPSCCSCCTLLTAAGSAANRRISIWHDSAHASVRLARLLQLLARAWRAGQRTASRALLHA